MASWMLGRTSRSSIGGSHTTLAERSCQLGETGVSERQRSPLRQRVTCRVAPDRSRAPRRRPIDGNEGRRGADSMKPVLALHALDHADSLVATGTGRSEGFLSQSVDCPRHEAAPCVVTIHPTLPTLRLSVSKGCCSVVDFRPPPPGVRLSLTLTFPAVGASSTRGTVATHKSCGSGRRSTSTH